MEKQILARAARVAVDVGKVGGAAIPIVGGSIVAVIDVLDDRRLRRVEHFRDELLGQLGDRVSDVEYRLAEEPFADLVDDAVERSARTRNAKHIELMARVVAEALREGASPEQLEHHHILLRLVAELLPAHLQLLVEIGTLRNISGQVMRPEPVIGCGRTQRSLASRFPSLDGVVEPLVADLIAAGLVMYEPEDVTKVIDAAAKGRRPMRTDETIALTPYGKWVIERLAELNDETQVASDVATPE